MWRTIDICPSSIRDDPQVRAACESIDKELEAIYADIPSINFWPWVEDQVEPMLDIMMWEYHVDQYQQIIDGSPLTREKKIDLINTSIRWHSHKGTKGLTEEVLRTVWPSAVIIEWYEYANDFPFMRGDPFYFKIRVNEPLYDIDVLYRAWDAVMAIKNVRSWLEWIERYDILHPTLLYVGCIAFIQGEIEVKNRIRGTP